jgi:integrase
VFTREGVAIASLNKAFKRACRLADQAGRIPHDLRRTAVRNLVRAGVPESVAMELTGHKTRSVFDRYNITANSDLATAASRLDAASGTIVGQFADLPAFSVAQPKSVTA